MGFVREMAFLVLSVTNGHCKILVYALIAVVNLNHCALQKYSLKSRLLLKNTSIYNLKNNEQHVRLNVVLVLLIFDIVDEIRNLICSSLNSDRELLVKVL